MNDPCRHSPVLNAIGTNSPPTKQTLTIAIDSTSEPHFKIRSLQSDPSKKHHVYK